MQQKCYVLDTSVATLILDGELWSQEPGLLVRYCRQYQGIVCIPIAYPEDCSPSILVFRLGIIMYCYLIIIYYNKHCEPLLFDDNATLWLQPVPIVKEFCIWWGYRDNK